MHFSPLSYHDGSLLFEGRPVETLLNNIKTPFYFYGEKTLLQYARHFKDEAKKHLPIPAQIHYALKANSNIELLKILQAENLGADVVSGAELQRALDAGIPAHKIVFSGVGKRDDEIQLALKSNILSLNVESLEELKVIDAIAAQQKATAQIAFRLNPNIAGNTHEKISTGSMQHKFGMPKEEILSAVEELHRYSHVKLIGLSCHIGSQLSSLKESQLAFQELCSLIKLCAQKLNTTFEFIDFGGGLGVPYRPLEESELSSLEEYMKMVSQVAESVLIGERLVKKVLFEPGRFIVAKAGALVSKVLFRKTNQQKNFLICDAAMNDLLRPTLYQAYHHIWSTSEASKTISYDVVGPICETGDTFCKDRPLSERLKRGDLLLFSDAGAYGRSMSSSYNLREIPEEYLLRPDGSIVKI